MTFRQSAYVVGRFCFRLLILGLFLAHAEKAALHPEEAAWQLFLLAAAVCGGVAVCLRERPFDRELTHWDESVTFLVLCLLVRWS